MRTVEAAALIVGLWVVTACHRPPASTGESTSAEPAAGPASPEAEAREIFATRCVPCHGAQGHGDGVAGAALNPHPRNFGDTAWQASITDANIERTIREGGAAMGKSPLMPPNPDLASRPEVVAALRAHVRSLAGH